MAISRFLMLAMGLIVLKMQSISQAGYSGGGALQKAKPPRSTLLKGCLHSLDWTTGLEYWTGLLDWSFFTFLGKFLYGFLVYFKIFDTWRPQFFLS